MKRIVTLLLLSFLVIGCAKPQAQEEVVKEETPEVEDIDPDGGTYESDYYEYHYSNDEHDWFNIKLIAKFENGNIKATIAEKNITNTDDFVTSTYIVKGDELSFSLTIPKEELGFGFKSTFKIRKGYVTPHAMGVDFEVEASTTKIGRAHV